MNSALQNRLVGTIIVVALVVILLPELLDGEKTQNNQEFVEIPPAPAAIEIKSPEPFPQQKLDDNAYRPAEIIDELALDELGENNEGQESGVLGQVEGEQEATAQSDPESSPQLAAPAPASPVLPRSQAPEVEIEVKDSGYVIQLGSFRNEKNVNELIATLRQAGYRAYSQPVQTRVGLLNKVFVGPELEREKLEQALSHLQELTKLKGKITAFEVSAE